MTRPIATRRRYWRPLLVGLLHGLLTGIFLAMSAETFPPLFLVVFGLVIVAHVLIEGLGMEDEWTL